jgi:hypothetical protein
LISAKTEIYEGLYEISPGIEFYWQFIRKIILKGINEGVIGKK